MSSELSASYLGLELSSPVIVGACPLTIEPEAVRQFVGAGAGAIVLPSMFQEQLVYRSMKAVDPLGAVEESGYLPQQDRYNGGADNYLRSIASLKENVSIPVIANLNVASMGEWVDFVIEIESAGADALECNVQSLKLDTAATSNDTEKKLCDVVAEIVSRVSIPVAVKISQRYTNLASMAGQLRTAGAKGLVLFAHLPNWDVCLDRKQWTVRWQLSPVDSLGGALEGIVRVHAGQLGIPLAASGGVATGEDALKAMMAGADVVMVTSAIYREGPDAIRKIVDGIRRYLEINHHRSLSDFQHSRPAADVGLDQVMRVNYIAPLTRSTAYLDPTPPASYSIGDAYGHLKD